jgi:N-acyl-D-aspartate/D-glutamate deacylase
MTKTRSSILRDLRVTAEELESQGDDKNEATLAHMKELLGKADEEGMLNGEFPRAVVCARKYGYASKTA